MKNTGVMQRIWHRCALALGAGATAFVLSSAAFAQHAGGGGHAGGGHAGGGHAAGGHVGGGGHGGYAGGYHGGYGGYHGGYGGWRGGYYGWHGAWCCGWGWPWWGPGLALGLYFSTLPLYYTTYWWDGVPYYYAENTFYVWDPSVGQYETVAPPPGVAAQVQGPAGGPNGELIVYPKSGQSDEQMSKDKFECHQWAVSQSGFDPSQAGAATNPSKRSDYLRADAACLTGRGYSVM